MSQDVCYNLVSNVLAIFFIAVVPIQLTVLLFSLHCFDLCTNYFTVRTLLLCDRYQHLHPYSHGPHQQIQGQLIKLLKDWKQHGKISQQLYWRLYPNADEPPKLYGTSKIHKQGAPFVLSFQVVAA